jgi:hypothetical protein
VVYYRVYCDTFSLYKGEKMVRIWNKLNFFWQFIAMLLALELLGFGFRWLYGVTGAFLRTPIWQGWLFAAMYCVVWLCAAVLFVLSWFCMYEYIFGGAIIAICTVFLTAKDYQKTRKQLPNVTYEKIPIRLDTEIN